MREPKFLPPVLAPPKILALALNYQEHIDETNLAFYNEPIVFEKYASNLVPHEGEIELPPFPQHVDEEHELALVVGRDCRHIRPHQAPDYIFGYTICNDVSARDRQRERLKMGQPYSYAKNFATFCPMGPWVVTAKELGDPRNLNMSVRINGKVTRSGNSKQMIFDPFEVAGLLLGLHADAGRRHHLARHLRGRQGDPRRRPGRARGGAHRGAAQPRRGQQDASGPISRPTSRPDRWCARSADDAAQRHCFMCCCCVRRLGSVLRNQPPERLAGMMRGPN